jgi:hypothetical protein
MDFEEGSIQELGRGYRSQLSLGGWHTRCIYSITLRVTQKLLIDSGAGKSVLSASIVGELQKIDGAIALYFFSRNGDVRTTSSLQMAASISAQLIHSISPGQDRNNALGILKRAVDNGAMYSDKGRNLKNIWTLFVDILRVYPKRVVVLLDGLDECSNPGSVHGPKRPKTG